MPRGASSATINTSIPTTTMLEETIMSTTLITIAVSEESVT
jgi:hypothetical protein